MLPPFWGCGWFEIYCDADPLVLHRHSGVAKLIELNGAALALVFIFASFQNYCDAVPLSRVYSLIGMPCCIA